MLKTIGKTTIELAQEPRVSAQGMKELDILFNAYTDNSLPDWASDLFVTKQADPHLKIDTPVGPKPVYYSGKIAKRIAQIAHKRYNVKLTQEQVCTLGTVAGNHKIGSQKIIYDITDSFDWRSGDFGDGGSCYWGDRSAARPVMEQSGCLALRFYNDTGGIGRCWIAPIGKDRFVLFNAYAQYDTWLHQNGSTLKAMAAILSEQYGFEQEQVELTNWGASCGTLWINNGTGIALYNGTLPNDYIDLEIEYNGTPPNNRIDLEIDVDDDLEVCAMCGYATEGTIYIESEHRSICEDCYCDNYSWCQHCEEPTRSDDMYWVESAELHLCEYCYNESFTECEECEEIVNRDNMHDDLCLDCSAGKIGVCDRCREAYELKNGNLPKVCTDLKRNPHSGWHDIVCNGAIMVHCAHCHEKTDVVDCYTDKDGLHYCAECKGWMTATCSVCHVEKNQSYMHSLGEKHYCAHCQPSLFDLAPGMLTIASCTKGIWNHAH